MNHKSTTTSYAGMRLTAITVAAAVIIWLIFKWLDPIFMEKWYSHGLFKCIRCSIDYSLGLVPFSIGLPLTLWFLVRTVIKCKACNWPSRLSGFVKGLAVLIIAFYGLWGYNYKRPGIISKFDLEVPTVDSTILESLFVDQLETLERLRPLLKAEYDFTSVVGDLRADLKTILYDQGYQVVCHPQLRRLPPGMLLRFSTAGVYNPWLGEGYIDVGLHPLQKPFVIAHELSHAFGITDEGEANFWGFMACRASYNADIRYSGELGFMRYVLSDLYRQSPKKYEVLKNRIPQEIINDLRAIDRNNAKYPDIMPDIRDAIYGSYLKSQGIKQGLRSYNDMVGYYLAWVGR